MHSQTLIISHGETKIMLKSVWIIRLSTVVHNTYGFIFSQNKEKKEVDNKQVLLNIRYLVTRYIYIYIYLPTFMYIYFITNQNQLKELTDD